MRVKVESVFIVDPKPFFVLVYLCNFPKNRIIILSLAFLYFLHFIFIIIIHFFLSPKLNNSGFLKRLPKRELELYLYVFNHKFPIAINVTITYSLITNIRNQGPRPDISWLALLFISMLVESAVLVPFVGIHTLL